MGSNEELSKKYQKKSDKQHVLDNPDTYIGSIENINCNAYVFDEESKKIIEKQITYNQEYYNTLKHIYKEKESIYLNIHYLLNFIDVYDIILNIYTNKIRDNILYLHINVSNIIVYLLITSLSFEIIKISYSDKLIDNNEILTSNKVIKNTNILNIYSLLFLEKYLTNNKNCIKINENDFL